MVTTVSDFEVAWNGYYPNCRPINYLMRAAGARYWVRFHSLPESKRYAETDEERNILLERQNTLGDEVLGAGDACWLVQTCWASPDLADIHDPFWACREYGLTFAFDFVDCHFGERAAWTVNAARTRWMSGGFDRLLWDIANERAGRTLWMSTTSGAVFAPYDGGVDLFLQNLPAVHDLKARHADWFSDHPEGV